MYVQHESLPLSLFSVILLPVGIRRWVPLSSGIAPHLEEWQVLIAFRRPVSGSDDTPER